METQESPRNYRQGDGIQSMAESPVGPHDGLKRPNSDKDINSAQAGEAFAGARVEEQVGDAD